MYDLAVYKNVIQPLLTKVKVTEIMNRYNSLLHQALGAVLACPSLPRKIGFEKPKNNKV